MPNKPSVLWYERDLMNDESFSLFNKFLSASPKALSSSRSASVLKNVKKKEESKKKEKERKKD